jgi:hydrogenase-1 operon protein HyaF
VGAVSLSDIGVKVENAPQPTGVAKALLREIAEHLSTLAASGQGNIIDLSGMPMNETDRQELVEALGRGEVQITISTFGQSEIYETTYPGVWWVTHRGDSGTVLAERIEITPIPEMVKTHPDDIRSACDRLRAATMPEDDQETR